MFLLFREVKNQWSDGHLIKSWESTDKLYRNNNSICKEDPPPKKKINNLAHTPDAFQTPTPKNKF